jgi:CBS domain containing-hemolysin-like protein
MRRLLAREAVLAFVERVDLEDLAPRSAEAGSVFAVFRGEAEFFVGLVIGSAVERAPGRPFAELLRCEPQLGVLDGVPAERALQQLRSSRGAAVAVRDDKGDFVGAVTQDSLMDALLRAERLRCDAVHLQHPSSSDQ